MKIAITILLTLVALLILLVVTLRLVLGKVLKNKKLNHCKLNNYAPNDAVVFLGDSLTDFYPMHDFFHQGRVINRGIANDRTKEILERIDEVERIKPKTVYLQIGINDFIRSFKRVDPIVVAKRIIGISERILTFADVRIISLYPVNKKKNLISHFSVSNVNNERITIVNDYLKGYCDTKNLVFIDVFKALKDKKGRLKKEYTIDGLHLNVSGYEVVSKVLWPYVKVDTIN